VAKADATVRIVPEGHTIHRLAKDLQKDLSHQPVTAISPQGRFAGGAALIDGNYLKNSEAWGKHLFCSWANGCILHIHLGLIGKFRRSDLSQAPTDTVRLRLETTRDAWQLTGPQTCAIIEKYEKDNLVSQLGLDPLRLGKRGKETFVTRVRSVSKPLGAALLNQKLIAGIGNVYRSEILFLAGIRPDVLGSELTQGQAESIWDITVIQLRRGREWNRIVTVTSDDLGKRVTRETPKENTLYAYKRGGLPCRRCLTFIEQSTSAGRSIWYCPSCQEGTYA
jgi:formamidopyrimidine-DNA glycosylase